MAWPDHLMTSGEFDELPGTTRELPEGVRHVTPKAIGHHQLVLTRFA